MQTLTTNLPPVLKSWEHLYATNPGLQRPVELPIDSLGTTYSMAQELTWLDKERFVVGRWDSSMGIFQFTQPATHREISSSIAITDTQLLAVAAYNIFKYKLR